MSQRENCCVRSDGHILTSADVKFPAIQQAAEIDNVAFPEMDFAPVQKAAAHLHRGARTQISEPSAQIESAQVARRQTTK